MCGCCVYSIRLIGIEKCKFQVFFYQSGNGMSGLPYPQLSNTSSTQKKDMEKVKYTTHSRGREREGYTLFHKTKHPLPVRVRYKINIYTILYI